MYPSDLKYTESHEWLRVEGNIGTVGITMHAQEQLGDIVFVEIFGTGTDIDRGNVLGTIESVKSVSEVYMPVSGKVIEFNEKLVDHPELVNIDPYGEGWIARIEIADIDEVETLLTAEEYEKIAG